MSQFKTNVGRTSDLTARIESRQARHEKLLSIDQQVRPRNLWHYRLAGLFNEFKEIPVFAMGLPKSWQKDKFRVLKGDGVR